MSEQNKIQKLLQEIKLNDYKKITLYTMDHCPACKELKKKLEHLNINYENVEMDGNEGMWKQLRERGGEDYVPQAEVEGLLLSKFEEINDLVGMVISEMVGRKIIIK